MKIKPIAIFGNVAYSVSAETGEKSTTNMGPDNAYNVGYYFYTGGRSTCIVRETGEQIADRTEGWFNAGNTDNNPSTPGTLDVTYTEPTTWICIPFVNNPSGITEGITSLVLKANETEVFPKGSNIHLSKGTLKVGDKIFEAPNQIRVRSGDVTVKATSKVFILLFP